MGGGEQKGDKIFGGLVCGSTVDTTVSLYVSVCAWGGWDAFWNVISVMSWVGLVNKSKSCLKVDRRVPIRKMSEGGSNPVVTVIQYQLAMAGCYRNSANGTFYLANPIDFWY